MNKTAVIIAVIILVVIAGAYFLMQKPSQPVSEENTTAGNYEMIQGMKVEILKEGAGAQVKPGDPVSVSYVGRFENGEEFDSNIGNDRPFTFSLGKNAVIQGWELGVLGMRVGEKRRLTIPPELGYGSEGFPPVVPPNAALIFEIDMLNIGE